MDGNKDFVFEERSERFERFWIWSLDYKEKEKEKVDMVKVKDKVKDKDNNGTVLDLGHEGNAIKIGLGFRRIGKDQIGIEDLEKECKRIGNGDVCGKFADRGMEKSSKDEGGVAGLADLLVKQGEFFCREIWPGLSIRNKFFNHCNINETSNTLTETLPFMTEMDSEVTKIFTNTVKKYTTNDYLGYNLPDLAFMLTASIQWPSEYLKQI